MPRFVRQQVIEHEIGPTGRFVLRVTTPDVDLRATDGPIATVRVEFELRADNDAHADQLLERVRFEVQERAGALEVTEQRHGAGGVGSIARLLGMGSGRFDSKVVAEVPAGAEVTFDGVSSDLDSFGFNGRQEYRMVSGDMTLRDLGGDLRVRGVSSDISLRAEAPIRLQLNTVSGDVSAVAPRYDALHIVTVSGDVEIEGELSRAEESRIETVSGDVQLSIHGGTTLEVRALSSDVSVSLPHRAEGSRDRRRFVIGDGAARVVFSSMSGDLIAGSPRRSVPMPPTPPTAPVPPTAPGDELAILRALERGDITVDEAAARLARRS